MEVPLEMIGKFVNLWRMWREEYRGARVFCPSLTGRDHSQQVLPAHDVPRADLSDLPRSTMKYLSHPFSTDTQDSLEFLQGDKDIVGIRWWLW